MAPNRQGYRGYVFSRAVEGHRVPQHIQNLVIRDYATRRGLLYLLSATEYAMPDSHLILEQVVSDLPAAEGIILYSMFLLPREQRRRLDLYRRILGVGAELHAAVEGFVLGSAADIERWENVLATAEICRAIPYREIERWLT